MSISDTELRKKSTRPDLIKKYKQKKRTSQHVPSPKISSPVEIFSNDNYMDEPQDTDLRDIP